MAPAKDQPELNYNNQNPDKSYILADKSYLPS